jgi:hypothetical protein
MVSMRSLNEPVSPMRVLIRIPDLSPGPAPAKAPEVETYVQQPLAPLISAPAKPPLKPPHHAESHGVTPDELKTSGRFAKPLTALAVLAVAAAVGVALSNRSKPDAPPPAPEQIVQVEIPPVPGGTPTEITKIPEISFPTAPAPAPASEPETMKIERLPGVAGAEGATARVSDSAAPGQAAQQPIVAKLEPRIEQPTPR